MDPSQRSMALLGRLRNAPTVRSSLKGARGFRQKLISDTVSTRPLPLWRRDITRIPVSRLSSRLSGCDSEGREGAAVSLIFLENSESSRDWLAEREGFEPSYMDPA